MGADAFPAIFLTNDDADEEIAAERDNVNMSLPCPVSLQAEEETRVCGSKRRSQMMFGASFMTYHIRGQLSGLTIATVLTPRMSIDYLFSLSNCCFQALQSQTIGGTRPSCASTEVRVYLLGKVNDGECFFVTAPRMAVLSRFRYVNEDMRIDITFQVICRTRVRACHGSWGGKIVSRQGG